MSEQIESLQRRILVLERRFFVVICCAVLAIFTLAFAAEVIVKTATQPDMLTVKRLAVVDDKGTERVVIASPLPDPIIQGKRLKRSAPISGILIFDPKGNERGGYVTSDAKDLGAFLTLDAEQGQVFTVYANAHSGATLSLANEKNDAIIMSTYKWPSIKMRGNNQVIFKQPSDATDRH